MKKEIEKEEKGLQKQLGASYALAIHIARAREEEVEISRKAALFAKEEDYLRCLRLTNQFITENPGEDHSHLGIEGERKLITRLNFDGTYDARKWYEIRFPDSWGPRSGH